MAGRLCVSTYSCDLRTSSVWIAASCVLNTNYKRRTMWSAHHKRGLLRSHWVLNKLLTWMFQNIQGASIVGCIKAFGYWFYSWHGEN